ncbi:tetratricopeptide repeat protein [Streptomyces klenkii]|uniref:tetratricopeptide repeat protein n=1 Tax=Streptomyces klenkii TaxID=1420899 RepID=UPI003410A94C
MVGGVVVWCGTPGGRDDAALVLLDGAPGGQVPLGAVRWGRMVTDRPGTACQTWGVPDLAQRPGKPVEAIQAEGRINAGSGFVSNQYVMDLLQYPPRWWEDGTSPWGGLSGAAVFCDGLLVGVVACDRAHSGHGQLNVVPAYVLHHDPAFRAALAGHGQAAAGLEAVELQHLTDPGAAGSGAVLRSPAALLAAGRQTVPFHGREDLLEQLRGWCALGGFGVWLVHGPGGQGKTRLAYQLTGVLAADGWATLWPRADATTSGLRDIRHAVKPLLVVVDYAETRTGQLAALVEAAAGHPGGTPVKVLLLARTDGDWWTHAKTATSLAEDYLDSAPSIRLAPLEEDPGLRAEAYRTAARALAGALPGVHGLDEHDWRTAANALPTPQLDHAGFANALTLQMTALADLLDTTAPARAVLELAERAEGVEDRLLGHERRYWRHSADTHGLTPGLSLRTLEGVLAAAHLVNAADREQADLTWLRLPALADQARDRRDTVTAWVAALYPATVPGRPWGALQPDRLAERHIGRVLDTDPALAALLLDAADDAQTAQLLTIYSRAAAHPVFDSRLDAHLTSLCTRHRHRLAPHIIATAVRTDRPQPLIAALDTLAADPTAEVDDLIPLHDQLPHSSRRLARTAVCLAQTLTGRYRLMAEANPDTYLPYLAVSLNNLSVRLGAVGRWAEGLTAIEEAVRIRRTLAENNPDAYLPDLAASLNNLSADLAKVGRRKEGLTPIEEAVRIRRTLAENNPDAYLPDLAMSLNNLSADLAKVGRRKEGLTPIEEAVGHYRTLAEANPDAYLPYLAVSLNNLSAGLGEVGRWAEGLTVIEEAVRIRRTLAENNPDAYLPDLAASLNNLSAGLGEVGRRAESLTAIEEAVGHYRTLAEANPDAYLPDLATSLNNLSIDLGEVGRRAEGLTAIEEAVGHYRTLAEANPELFEEGLRRSLDIAAWLKSRPQ